MSIAELEEKVTKAAERVEKCKKTIERHEQQLTKKINSGASKFDIEWKQEDIKGATKKLKEAADILTNWKGKLDLEIEKDRFLNDNAPQVIKDFLNQWKEMAYQWYVKRFDAYQDLKKKLKQEVMGAIIEAVKNIPEYAQYLDEKGEVKDMTEYNLINVYPRKPMDAYLKSKGLDYRGVRTKEAAFAGSMILQMDTFYKEQERLAWLEKELERDRKAKMLDLIYRVNAVVGTITDASNLRISPEGNLNGYIIGEKASAKVETIGAGGWNIQCFHYRTLIHKLNKEVIA